MLVGSEVKKALIERLLYLNSQTNAFEDMPHKITCEELQKSLKRSKLFFNIQLAFTIIIVIMFFYIFPSQEDANNRSGFLLILIVALFSTLSRSYLKIIKIREQIFLQGVIDKIEHGIK